MEQLELSNTNRGNNAKEYDNCINVPIIGNNAFKQHTAPMPLHTFLGVAQKCLDIGRDHCIALDKELVDKNIFSNNRSNNNNNTKTASINYNALLIEIA